MSIGGNSDGCLGQVNNEGAIGSGTGELDHLRQCKREASQKEMFSIINRYFISASGGIRNRFDSRAICCTLSRRLPSRNHERSRRASASRAKKVARTDREFRRAKS